MVVATIPAGTVTQASPTPRTRTALIASSRAPTVRVPGQNIARATTASRSRPAATVGPIWSRARAPVTPPAEAKRPRGHPAEPDYPGAGHPTEKRRRASRSGARAATRYPQGPEGVAGRAGPTHAG